MSCTATTRRLAVLLTFLAFTTTAGHVRAQDPNFDLDLFISDELQKVHDSLISDAEAAALETEAAEAQQRAGSRWEIKQVETPVMFGNSTTLVDSSSVGDLFNVALNLAELTGTTKDDAETDATALAASTTLYALYSAIEGQDPLDPAYYCRGSSKMARRFSIGAGREDGKEGLPDATVLGLKVYFGKDPCDYDLGPITAGLRTAARDDNDLRAELYEELWPTLHPQGPAISNVADNPAASMELEDAIREDPVIQAEAKRVVLDLIEKYTDESEAYRGLADITVAEVKKLERAYQPALSFSSKQKKGGLDEYSAMFILDGRTFFESVDFNLNAGWAMKKRPRAKDEQGGEFAVGVHWQPGKDRLEGRRPMRLSLAANAKWMTQAEDTYRGQAKFVLPLLNGIELPISLTVANRTELVDETDVRGQVGFTIDTSQLLRAFK